MLNQITLQGRLTADPELKETPGGVRYASFCLAVDRDRRKADGETRTDFFECVAWRGVAEFIAARFGRGKPMTVSGSMQGENWTDAEGRNRRTWRVNVERAWFLGPPARPLEDGAPPELPPVVAELPF